MKLVDYKEIAKLIRKSELYTRDVILKRPGIPKPFIAGRPNLYIESEIINYFLKQRNAA